MRKQRVKVLVGVVSTSALVMVGVGLGGGTAWAGGWAISSLDAMPVPVAGRDLDVGFTIRQHGVRPVNPTGQVGVGIRSESGSEQFFAATSVGPSGHYVARVRILEPGSYRWQIRQGWFDTQDLGRIEVAGAGVGATAGTDGQAGASGYRWPRSVRLLIPAIGLAFGVFAMLDLAARRRRSRDRTVPNPIEA